MLGFADAPVLSAQGAGKRLAGLAQGYDFSLVEYWASDYAGHKQDMDWAVEQLETLDGMLERLVEVWGLEGLSARRHTRAKVPGLVIGRQHGRITQNLDDLTGIAQRLLALLTG